MNENKKTCYWCGAEIGENELYHEHDDCIWCDECFWDNFAYCTLCDNIERIYDLRIDPDGDWLCESCFNRHWTYCDDCGRVISWSTYNDNNGYCEYCYEDYVLISGYHSHCYHPVGIPAKNEWYKGIELEVDNGNDNNALALELNDIANSDREHIYFETDGSLNSGFEIITQPHTTTEFYNIDWNGILTACVNHDFKSHNTNTCGLHIHYSREWFGKTSAKQQYNIGKLLAFYERNFDEMLKFSRRGERWHDWAEKYYLHTPKECTAQVKKPKWEQNRYHAINLTNDHTIEFRLGRGTLLVESFLAWNDFHDCLVKNCKKATYKRVDDLGVWLKGIRPETIAYLKSRNIFPAFTAQF